MNRPPQPISPSQSRGGASMIEALLAVSIGAIVLTVGVGTIHVLLRGERETRRTLESTIRLSRLSSIVRRDVHAAQSAVIAQKRGSAAARLVLTFPARRTVTYVADGPSLRRIDENPMTGGHRDSFRFPAGATIRIERSGSPELVRIEIDRGIRRIGSKPGRHVSPPGTTRSRRIVRIDALLARDHRYVRQHR